ncbi:MAG: hypothetical protein JL50_10885 [Peptococcaceae bacterium BICA1-7]|nr:MAG: hypothetical protein JL50_10885 [Peptococcaceae bacterium BICA1-7]HBV95789.1 hypothetical protein [Desulfotomaculum sp.]
MQYIDMKGKRYGRLTVIERAHNDKRGTVYWKCLCDCGKETIKSGQLIRLGKTKSCGCLGVEFLKSIGERTKTHGMGKTKLNYVWQEMKERCSNPNHKQYKNYGGRGITFQESWKDFIEFYNDMHATYTEGLTLDRIDNNKGYSKDNCRWTTALRQSNNKRNNVYETVDGITATRSELCDLYKVPRCTFYWRISHGMTVEEALKKTTTKGT